MQGSWSRSQDKLSLQLTVYVPADRNQSPPQDTAPFVVVVFFLWYRFCYFISHVSFYCSANNRYSPKHWSFFQFIVIAAFILGIKDGFLVVWAAGQVRSTAYNLSGANVTYIIPWISFQLIVVILSDIPYPTPTSVLLLNAIKMEWKLCWTAVLSMPIII